MDKKESDGTIEDAGPLSGDASAALKKKCAVHFAMKEDQFEV